MSEQKLWQLDRCANGDGWLLSGPAYGGAIELVGSTEETARALCDRLNYADGNLAPVVREAAELRARIDLAEKIADHHLRDHPECGYIKTRDQALIEQGCVHYDHGDFTLCEVERARRRRPAPAPVEGER